MNKKIAIIGGGASATLLLAHLSKYDLHGSVDVYDRSGRFARGVAYSTRHDCHLLNVRAANMSAYQDDKEHFARWAGIHGYTPSDFVPRKLYGLYLQEVLQDAMRILTVHKIEKDVLGSRRAGDGSYFLRLSDAEEAYDAVILATGNVRSLRPRGGAGVKLYFDDPWTIDFANLSEVKKIALIGSGLTAVDMALALEAENYRGEIFIFSRNSLLPAVHVDPAAYEPFLSEKAGFGSPATLLKKIRHEVRKAAKNNLPWQAVIDSLRAYTNPVWKSWNEKERRRFMKRLLTFWNVHRHRMAPQIAKTLSRLQAEGRLHMIKAGVISVAAGPVLKTSSGDFEMDAVINCLGYRYEEDDRAYEVSERIGPPNFGELFETTAVPEIRTQAHALAEKIMQ